MPAVDSSQALGKKDGDLGARRIKNVMWLDLIETGESFAIIHGEVDVYFKVTH